MRFEDSAVLRVLDRERVQVLATYKQPVLHHSLQLAWPQNRVGKPAYKGQHRYLRHEAEMTGRAAVVLSRLKRGRVLLFGPHPELNASAPEKLPGGSARSVLKDLILHVVAERDRACRMSIAAVGA